MKTGGELKRRKRGGIDKWGLDVTGPVWEQGAVRVRAGKAGQRESVAVTPEAGIYEDRAKWRPPDTRRAPPMREEEGWPVRGQQHSAHEVSIFSGQRTGNRVCVRIMTPTRQWGQSRVKGGAEAMAGLAVI